MKQRNERCGIHSASGNTAKLYDRGPARQAFSHLHDTWEGQQLHTTQIILPEILVRHPKNDTDQY